jgi:hypothetical protein
MTTQTAKDTTSTAQKQTPKHSTQLSPLTSVVLLSFGILVIAVLALSSGSSPSEPKQTTTQHRARPKLKLRATERLLIQAADVAAGKAMQAALSDDGLYEGRTAGEWCSVAGDAINDVVFPNTGSFDHQNTPTKRGLRIQRENKTIRTVEKFCLG